MPTPADIASDASWLVQAFDPASGLIRVVKMSRGDYRAASFLDDRLFQTSRETHILPMADVAAAIPQGSRSDARWIFHIGHVGSTLVARLLGELPAVLSIREPRILRDLTTVSDANRARLARTAASLLSRTFESGELAVVKATSFVSEIAPKLVSPTSKALMIYAQPRAYIAGILAGENSVKELRILADLRAKRMADRVPVVEKFKISDAHLAAAAWACEMTSLEKAADTIGPERTYWADFDHMLTNMSNALGQVCDHLGITTDPATLDAIAAGPLMSRYSKAPEYDYSPSLRRELLDEASDQHATDIADALAMLHNLAENSPLLLRAIKRAGGKS